MNQHDPLYLMFKELRLQIPPFTNEEETGYYQQAQLTWLLSMKPILQAMPEEQAWACTVMLAHDIVSTRYTGMPLGMCFMWLERVFKAQEVTP